MPRQTILATCKKKLEGVLPQACTVNVGSQGLPSRNKKARHFHAEPFCLIKNRLIKELEYWMLAYL